MIGRKKETTELNKLYDKNSAEFVAIYGRRRVGKTYLVDETFSGRITFRSNFIQAFEGFWNTWACHRKNLMLVVCGSANSWILDKLINAHGGLYNRVTHEMKLSPFTLSECEDFYKANNVKISRYDIVQSYMVFGGIPF